MQTYLFRGWEISTQGNLIIHLRGTSPTSSWSPFATPSLLGALCEGLTGSLAERLFARISIPFQYSPEFHYRGEQREQPVRTKGQTPC